MDKIEIKVYLATTMFTEKTKSMVENIGFKVRKPFKNELYPDEENIFSYVLDESQYKTIKIESETNKFIEFLKLFQAKANGDTFILYAWEVTNVNS